MKHNLNEIFDDFGLNSCGTEMVVSDELTTQAIKNMLGILAMLRTMHWEFYTSHWKVKGLSFYGDHLLFARLYGNVEKEFDSWAEKIMGTINQTTGIDSIPQMGMAIKWLARIEQIDCCFDRALSLENMFLDGIKECKRSCDSGGLLTIGIENMLDQMFDDHEGHVYLIKQKLS